MMAAVHQVTGWGVFPRSNALARISRSLIIGLLSLLLSACRSEVTLFDGLPESQANAVLSALLDAQIDARKQSGKEGVGVVVRDVDAARALTLLRRQGLPQMPFEGLGAVFRKEGLVASPLAERARYLHALSQELANTLTLMDGVLAARVHVVLAERSGMSTVGTPASASVFIKHAAPYPIDIYLPRIRAMVAHGVPGLTVDAVSVALFPAHLEDDRPTVPATAPVSGLTGSAPLVLAMIAAALLGAALWAVAFHHRLAAVRLLGARWLGRLRQKGGAA